MALEGRFGTRSGVGGVLCVRFPQIGGAPAHLLSTSPPGPCAALRALLGLGRGENIFFVPGRRGACVFECQDQACAGGATFPCHLPSSLNASAIMINLSGAYEYADEALGFQAVLSGEAACDGLAAAFRREMSCTGAENK